MHHTAVQGDTPNPSLLDEIFRLHQLFVESLLFLAKRQQRHLAVRPKVPSVKSTTQSAGPPFPFLLLLFLFFGFFVLRSHPRDNVGERIHEDLHTLSKQTNDKQRLTSMRLMKGAFKGRS